MGSCLRRTQASTSSVSCIRRWRELVRLRLRLQDNHCGAVEPYQTNLRACLRLHKSDLWPNKTQMKAGPVPANHGNPRTSRLGMPKPRLLPVLLKKECAASPAAILSTEAVQAEYAWFLQNSTRAATTRLLASRLSAPYTLTWHHAAGTLPPSGTRGGTISEEEAHFSYAYMSPPL